MSVTQKEIAQHLGLSRISVARALNGYANVPEATRLRVEEAARELGYDSKSNLGAKSLIARRYGRRVQTDIIALLMPVTFFEGVALPSLPFFAPFIAGVQEEATARGMDVFLCSPRQGKLPALVASGGVDGVICLATPPPEITRVELPAVNFGGPGGDWATGLFPDNRAGTARITEHLLSLGHRRIAGLMFSPQDGYAPAVERTAGYRLTLETHGLWDEDLLLQDITSPTEEAGYSAMVQLLAAGRDFSAVVCFNDLIAMGAMRALAEAGRLVPGDVSVAGFDDVSPQYPGAVKVTSIAFDRLAMGKRAVAVIDDGRGAQAREGHKPPGRAGDCFPVQLMVRDSTAPFAGAQPASAKTRPKSKRA